MKDDPQFNIHFVKCVEKHPCLYNHNIIEYSNRDEQERAWQEVALEVKASVIDCKNKWKNLRGSLTRYLLRARGPQFGDKPIKPYYMFEALSFLLPFTKTRKPRSKYEPYGYWGEGLSLPHNTKVEEDESFQSVSECYEDEVIPWDGSPSPEVDLEEDDEPLTGTDSLQDTQDQPPAVKRPRLFEPTPLEESLIGCLNSLTEQQENPDLEFFKSILPDIAGFSPRQKRILKQGILRLIDQVEEEEVDAKNKKASARNAPPSSTSN